MLYDNNRIVFDTGARTICTGSKRGITNLCWQDVVSTITSFGTNIEQFKVRDNHVEKWDKDGGYCNNTALIEFQFGDNDKFHLFAVC